jgi:hypothetical protein
VLADLVDLDDVGVIDASEGPGLALEARAGVAGEGVAAQHLDRHRSLEARIARAIDHAHRAAAGHAVDREPTDRGRVRGFGRGRVADGAARGPRDPGDRPPAVGAGVDVGQRGLDAAPLSPPAANASAVASSRCATRHRGSARPRVATARGAR